jgi:hypothetical protein
MYMTYRSLITALGIGTATALAACSGSGSDHATAPAGSKLEAEASEDVANVSANEVSSNVADYQQAEADARIGGSFGPGGGPNLQMGGPLGPGPGGREMFPPGLGSGIGGVGGGGWGWGPQASVDGACSLDSVGFTFTFPASDPTDTVAYARTWQLFSAAGCESAFVADSTDSIASTYAFIGDFNGDSQPWDGHHHGSSANALTATQEPGTDSLLASASTHVWNGSANTFDSVSFNGTSEQRAHKWLAYDTTTDVTFPNPRHGDWFPLSGTWTRWLADTLQVTGDTTVSKDYALHLLLTFAPDSAGQGSQDAILQVYDASTGALLQTCTVDLRRGHTVHNSCH